VSGVVRTSRTKTDYDHSDEEISRLCSCQAIYMTSTCYYDASLMKIRFQCWSVRPLSTLLLRNNNQPNLSH